MDPAVSPQLNSASSRDPHLILMWRGNVRAPHQPTRHADRLVPLVRALSDRGVATSSLIYFDADAEVARARLLQADGVMVWINPLQDGQDRTVVDDLLRDVASRGVWVSAHPDTILKLGTKEVLHRTRHLGWGSDTEFYRSAEDFELRFPLKLPLAGPRVLKPLRGNDGQGVLKVSLSSGDATSVDVQAASDDQTETLQLEDFVRRMHQRFGDDLRLVDQRFQSNVAAGMVRCYLSGSRVVGFAEQTPRSARNPFGMNSVKTMHPAETAVFQNLRHSMEQDWIPALQRELDLPTLALPALWDADFLYRSPDDIAVSRFALCEINVSSVSPFPDVAAPAVAATVRNSLAR